MPVIGSHIHDENSDQSNVSENYMAVAMKCHLTALLKATNCQCTSTGRKPFFYRDRAHND